MEEFAIDDPTQLLEAAAEFDNYPGFQNDDSVKLFLDRFPLPVILNALQARTDVPGLEDVLVSSLERVFKTRYGSSLIPQFMPFIQVGLQADSQPVRGLACKTVSCLIQSINEENVSAAQLIHEYDIYPLLLDCLVKGNEKVATASTNAIKDLACSPNGMAIVFPANANEATHLKSVALKCSSLGRVRVLDLIVKLFSVSRSLASSVYNSDLLGLLEAEVGNISDTLVVLNVLELLYELAEVEHGSELLSRTNLLQLLSPIISNTSLDSILRTRAMMISGRILDKENVFKFIDESSVISIISVIDGRLESMQSEDTDEYESALEALGQIGSYVLSLKLLSLAASRHSLIITCPCLLAKHGAQLLLVSSPPAARHVVYAAFNQQVHGKQLAALHSLGNICGELRADNDVLLNREAEESLRRLIYETASKSPKLTPSGLFLSIFRQEAEIRLAGYRLLTGLAARVWAFREIYTKQDIITIVTDPLSATTKRGMEARYKCCKAMHKTLTSSSNMMNDPAVAGIASKLEEAIQKGPYLSTKRQDAQPLVITAERF